MNKYLDQVTSELLTPYGIGYDDLDNLLGQLYKKGCDDMDIFVQKIWEESWTLEEGIIKDLSKSNFSNFSPKKFNFYLEDYFYENKLNSYFV